MSLQPLQRVLGHLEGRYKREPQQLAQVQACWSEIVGTIVAAQTRPSHLQRGVLKVATSGAVWAQNLVFERQRILAKLNDALPFQVNDIRFSTGSWQESPLASFPGDEAQTILWQSHPSRLSSLSGKGNPSVTQPESVTSPVDPVMAFQTWANQMRSRSKDLPLCPHCHCPTPPGELERWQECSICAAKHWQ
jgi:predicted nucleic acid-binding Zn ribbon protein